MTLAYGLEQLRLYKLASTQPFFTVTFCRVCNYTLLHIRVACYTAVSTAVRRYRALQPTQYTCASAVFAYSCSVLYSCRSYYVVRDHRTHSVTERRGLRSGLYMYTAVARSDLSGVTAVQAGWVYTPQHLTSWFLRLQQLQQLCIDYRVYNGYRTAVLCMYMRSQHSTHTQRPRKRNRKRPAPPPPQRRPHARTGRSPLGWRAGRCLAAICT